MQNNPLNLFFSCGEITKVILHSKSWCEMLVLKLSGIQNILYIYKNSYNAIKRKIQLLFDKQSRALKKGGDF